jgi:hypothetical protein
MTASPYISKKVTLDPANTSWCQITSAPTSLITPSCPLATREFKTIYSSFVVWWLHRFATKTLLGSAAAILKATDHISLRRYYKLTNSKGDVRSFA